MIAYLLRVACFFGWHDWRLLYFNSVADVKLACSRCSRQKTKSYKHYAEK